MKIAFSQMVAQVAKWCAERSDRVAMALVSLRSNKIVFYIIPKGESFDFDLGFAQAKLDLFLNSFGTTGYAETRQIPAWEIETFVPSGALRVWPKN